MTEATEDPGWGLMKYTCGRCGYTFETPSEAEYKKLYQAHTGPACLAILGKLTGDEIRYLAHDIIRLMAPEQTILSLVKVLEMLATHRDTTTKKAPKAT